MTRTYRFVAALLRPAMWWGRAKVEGREHVPAEGPVLVVPNHDSQWDPVVVALAVSRRRQLHFLGHASLWRKPLLGRLLSALGQIPIHRGGHDREALANAVAMLEEGAAVCIFPEGHRSRGETLRARSGVGWLAHAHPQARTVLCAVRGTIDYARFPRRPRVRIRFFLPAGGDFKPGEDPTDFAARLLGEVRAEAPAVTCRRRPSRPTDSPASRE